MWIKCKVALLNAGPMQVKKGKFSPDEGIIKCKVSFRNTMGFNVARGVESVPYKVGRRKVVPLWFVDVKSREAVTVGSLVADVDVNMGSKLDLLMRNQFWRFLGGRALDTLEMLLMLAAGYGIMRLIEFIVYAIFAE